jgi:TfoX/Sxy family transcriptional regulator of competence genes
MPKFEKSSPELVARFGRAIDRLDAGDVTVRQMFGYPCAWVRGNMTTGLFAEQWWIRVAGTDRDALLALPGTHPFEPMPGRAMKDYLVLPESVVADDAALDRWLVVAVDASRALPAKR